MKKLAWYFPNWHVDPLNERWHGKGWTEWECVKFAVPRFEGHQQPRVPLWGYGDESDPEVFAQKIAAAHEYGLDGFIFDYYWFKEEGPYRRECLEKGFLGAKNNELCEFSVMWCNHDPIYVHPASYRLDNIKLASGSVDADFVREVTDYCIENYFPCKNYTRIYGKVYFGIWDMERFIEDFGSIEATADVLQDFRDRAAKAGFELHIATHKLRFPAFKSGDKSVCDADLKTLGIDSLFSYNWQLGACEEWPELDYAAYRERNVKRYAQDSEFCSVPMDITVCTGWDCSPRTVASDKFEPIGYPFCPITANNTPEEVEKAFCAAKEFTESDKFTGNILTVSTWNEWTEGNYMEPDELYGYGYLEAFKRVFGK